MKSLKKRRRRWAGVLLGLGIAAGAVDYFWINLFGGFWAITNVHRYQSVLDAVRRETPDYSHGIDPVANFPASIPASAVNVKLFYWTPPGDTDFELRFTLPAAELTALVGRISPRDVSMTHGPDQWSLYPTFYVGDTEGPWKLPENYTLYQLVSERNVLIDGGIHRVYNSGIAVDPKNDDVIYWYSSHDGGM